MQVPFYIPETFKLKTLLLKEVEYMLSVDFSIISKKLEVVVLLNDNEYFVIKDNCFENIQEIKDKFKIIPFNEKTNANKKL